ncbi:heterokaryon incompatibility protein-domain-containing protein [Stachybotrys elegans]|uniref:Heterokaryon incompatibility protein-domain-containing protein n=1 Tax=Stachybotrys elegans TaxID=80388 RepID=A0A8K0SGN5_9HYPO|nr:heterokaryon incompatibility protein-domain-containing protein [Stachybotrys elegans]
MWLINNETLALEEFIGHSIPPYGILSHTWLDGEEVSFQEMRQQPGIHGKRGWEKIEMTCRLAAQDGLKYAWVDTCCIDKSSSAELTEAINSMYNWYKRSVRCYAHLSDLRTVITMESLSDPEVVGCCRWFQRGWTLQELIAPSDIKFYNRNWEYCFDKSDTAYQLGMISSVDPDILSHSKDLSTISVAQKMSWAARRCTTRTEDTAYCLLGIFDINMPLLYGEGEKAFSRLQAEIIRACPDPSILAWTYPKDGDDLGMQTRFSGVLAPSPAFFASCRHMEKLDGYFLPDFSMSNRGIKLRAKFGRGSFEGEDGFGLILPVGRYLSEDFCIQLRNMGDGCFYRQNPGSLLSASSSYLPPWMSRITFEPYLATQLPGKSFTKSRECISASRSRCMQFHVSSRMEIYNNWPWVNWDDVDTVFFTPTPSYPGWAALKVVCVMPRFDGYCPHESFDFLFYTFYWGETLEMPPECGVHRLFGTLADRHLEELNTRAVEEKWDAYWVSNRLRMNETPQHSVIIGPSSKQSTLLLKYELQVVRDDTVCRGTFRRVKFYWEIVPKNEVPTLTDRKWANIMLHSR